jgi:SAM-dependent methyltransferase
MGEFWESVYKQNEKMWGENPTDNAYEVLKIMRKHKIESILIPGFGYGRNAKVFHNNGFIVSGIEISETAIQRARNHFGNSTVIHRGSVTDMPFDNQRFDAVYCYSIVHLLTTTERKKLIHDCFMQLKPNGIMVFVALSVNDHRFGLGTELENNTFQSPEGLSLYFYDEKSVQEEFGSYNPLEIKEINEPEESPNEKHWMIVCEKK